MSYGCADGIKNQNALIGRNGFYSLPQSLGRLG
jgi:hypothetical protein